MFGAKKPTGPKVTRGTSRACGCPHCGRANDFGDITEMLEAGNTFTCDHCGNEMEVIQVKKETTLIWLRQV